MKHHTTLGYLQEYVGSRSSADPQTAALRLVERVGDLSHSVRKDIRCDSGSIRTGCVEDTVCAALLELISLANSLNIDLEVTLQKRETGQRFSSVPFTAGK